MFVEAVDVYYRNAKIGTLKQYRNNLVGLAYTGKWLKEGFSISPFLLPLEKTTFFYKIVSGGKYSVDRLLFNISVYDGYHKLLIDYILNIHNCALNEVSYLDKLAILAGLGIGGLSYRPVKIKAKMTKLFRSICAQARVVLDMALPDSLEQFFENSTNVYGHRLTALFTQINKECWIIKSKNEHWVCSENNGEYYYTNIARKAGLDVPETNILENKYLAVKRFDYAENGEKILSLPAYALLEKPGGRLDYVDLLNLALKLTQSKEETIKLFRRMCFNVFAHDHDDHFSKFTFLYVNNKWRVSPNYDLNFSKLRILDQEHYTSVDGEFRKISIKHILQVAEKVNIPLETAERVIAEVKAATACLQKKIPMWNRKYILSALP
ncbi:MAG: HipA domain-containing protein [Candidatus Margulisbacteria bacterium]|jgi:serine/threonine-protein kinase HipA|nr:HipA domain-containing protein [Candidatus Margulisiibacteriota bacterium]